MATHLNETLGGQLSDGFHFGDVLGMRRTESSAGEATFEIEIGPQHLNRHGTVHSGVLMAMLDTAGLWAVSDPDNATPPKAVTVSLNCNFIGRSGAGDTIIREIGRISKHCKRIYFASIVAESQPSGQLVATGQGVYNRIA
ncbi:PaaI family thioesterase [Rhodopseudomonas boonkerdii]|jgi:uncharacterized protein (TIGR00369 family)|uniref:PaaI family thioesterase n=1 Tax=Rhodopseudomonas boonkerdii TaxID=475937 RepID=UPI001E6237F5|nr:PaaI family thioesterase [Rhodopseudomonas boonkerdii]MCX7320859.1 PaaI family thioesterase [Hyphomicrobiales bacterium]UGV28622.1 PaaI family thioesterase [Rhodopseudomonas boonkerdii]